MNTTAAQSMADAALERIASVTAGHEPGQPYLLSREAFSRFWDELCDYSARAQHDDRASLWVAIASSEARRQFSVGWDRCHSELFFTTEQNGTCQWWYETTSGTNLFALDWRDSEPAEDIDIRFDQVIAPLEGVLPWKPSNPENPWADPENPWALIGPDGFYAVVIPAKRDQPGRTAWTQIRLAIAGLDYRCWSQEQENDNGHDEIGAARAAVRAALCPPA
jgi:hypothetical protein